MGWLLALLFLGRIAAQEVPSAEIEQILRAWLVVPPSPIADGMLDRLVTAFESVAEASGAAARVEAAVTGTLARRVPLAPGFHVVAVPGFDPPFDLAVIVPQAPPSSAGHRLLIAPIMSALEAPDELNLRARYGPWLDLGFVVASPATFLLAGDPVAPQGRDPWADGHDCAGTIIATLAMNHPIDRDGVVFLSRFFESQRPSTDAVPFFKGDPTPFAAVHHLVPGSRLAGDLSFAGSLAARRLVIHLSAHAGDASMIAARRAIHRTTAEGGKGKILRDPAMNYEKKWRFDAALLGELIAEFRRDPEPAAIEFVAGGKGPSSFEWLELAPLPRPLRVAARRAGTAIAITTPDEPELLLLAGSVFLSDAPASIGITLNGRPVFGGPPPIGARQSLLAARHAARTGRRTAAVVGF